MVTKPLRVESIAWSEVAEIIDWYNEQQNGRGAIFYDEFDSYLNKIKGNPKTFAFYNTEVRVAHLKIHPYFIFYAEREHVIFILAVIHNKRSNRHIRKRISKR